MHEESEFKFNFVTIRVYPSKSLSGKSRPTTVLYFKLNAFLQR